MCDTFVALSTTTLNGSVLFAKSADCEVNEANALVRIARQKHEVGEGVRITHRMIPQARETYEVLLVKAFWTYGCEIGVNEYGLSMGEEAVYTTEGNNEKEDGIIGPDMTRIALERAKNCQEAIEVVISLLEEFGQGGNCEMSGNSHFDSSYLIADTKEAYILETAGRSWAVKKIDEFDSISNMLSIENDWLRSSTGKNRQKLNWSQTYSLLDIPATLGAPERRSITYNALSQVAGNISVKTAFDIMRQHGSSYHPALPETHRNICMHAGPFRNRWWQADGVMVSDVGDHGVMAWVTGTSGTCVSIFKPVFLGLELPDLGPTPTEHFNPSCLWWKHELLHRRAMADFINLVPEIRNDFDSLEEEFLIEVETVLKGSFQEKKEFMDHCFRRAMRATEEWIRRLRNRNDLNFNEYPKYAEMWRIFNSLAGLRGMPA